MASFTIERLIHAPPSTVFDVVSDHRGYASITRLRRSELETEGDPAPNGVGAVRRLTIAGPPLRELITGYEPGVRLTYTVLSGLPVRDHVGTVSLAEVPGGTRMTYRVETTPTLPGPLGSAVVAVIRMAVGDLVGGVAGTAERRT